MAEAPPRFPVLTVLHQIRRSTLAKEQRSVLQACALRANAKGEVLATVEDLAADTGWSTSSVKRARADLTRMGLLQKPRRYGRVRIRIDLLERFRRPDPHEPEDPWEDTKAEVLTDAATGQGEPSTAQGDPSTGQGEPSPPSEPDSGRGQGEPGRGQGGPGRGQAGPPSTTSTSSGPSDGSTSLPSKGGRVLKFPSAPSSESKDEPEEERTPVRIVLDAWWALWEIRAPHVEGYKRKRTGKAQGAPATPDFTADDRQAIAKALRGRNRRTVDELLLLARWAFTAPGFHPRLLRGEAKPDQTLNEHLTPTALYRTSKIAGKLAKARPWHDGGEVPDNGLSPQRAGGSRSDYVPLDELWGNPGPPPGGHPPIDVPFEPAD